MSKLTSVRDFGIIYNAYLKFEEAMLEIDEDSDEYETSYEDAKEELKEEKMEVIEELKESAVT